MIRIADLPTARVRFIGVAELAAFVAWGRFARAPIAPRGTPSRMAETT